MEGGQTARLRAESGPLPEGRALAIGQRVAAASSAPLPHCSRHGGQREDTYASFCESRSASFASLASFNGSKGSLAGEKAGATTAWQTALNVVKCTVGAGSMAIPFVFKLGRNVPLTFAVMLAVGALCAYTIVMLSKCEQRLARGEKVGVGDYQSMAGDQPLLLTLPEVGGKYRCPHALIGMMVSH